MEREMSLHEIHALHISPSIFKERGGGGDGKGGEGEGKRGKEVPS